MSHPDSQARGRYNLSQDHGRLYISYRRTRSVHTHGGGLKHTGQHEGRPCRLCPEDGIFARIRGQRGHILSSPGSQYISSELAACSAAHDVRLSVGRTGSCHDNALAESLFATLKNEWYYHKRLSDASTTKHKAHEFNRVVLQPRSPA
ncbi:MAG: transposase family protein [Atopobium sp.]|nr:transposase family protein [Atopobium sp.]